jgi:DNA-binding NarL/FixJ family response regulator
MDIRMPGMDGLEATRRLMTLKSPPHVLMLTTFDLDEYIYDALRAGASGFLLKDVRPEQLADAVRTVATGDTLLAPSDHTASGRAVPASPATRLPDAARPRRANRPRTGCTPPGGAGQIKPANRQRSLPR